MLPGNLVAVNLSEIKSAGQQRFILDSDLKGIGCEALVAIAEPAQHHPFPGWERAQEIGVGFDRIQRLIDCGESGCGRRDVQSGRCRVGVSWLGFEKRRSAVVNGSVSTRSPTPNRDVGPKKVGISFDRRTK